MSEDDGSDPTTRIPAVTRSDDASASAIPLTFGPTVTLFFSDIRGFTEYTDARGCAAAVAGEILVSEGVRHVVGKMEGTDYIDRGHFELKGFHEPQHLYAVDWSGLGAGPVASAPQVGQTPVQRMVGSPVREQGPPT